MLMLLENMYPSLQSHILSLREVQDNKGEWYKKKVTIFMKVKLADVPNKNNFNIRLNNQKDMFL